MWALLPRIRRLWLEISDQEVARGLEVCTLETTEGTPRVSEEEGKAEGSIVRSTHSRVRLHSEPPDWSKMVTTTCPGVTGTS